MRFEAKDGVTHIYLDPDEPEQLALRSIVRASFAAAVVDPELSINDAGYEMTDAEADLFIRKEPRLYDGLVVEMNKVDGRLCSTVVYKVGDYHFSLYNRYYERFRGQPEAMLREAARLLHDSLQVATRGTSLAQTTSACR